MPTQKELEQKVAKLEAQLAHKDAQQDTHKENQGRWRSLGVGLLALIAALLFCSSITSFWVKQTLLDTNTWVSKTTQILQNTSVQNDIATKAIDSLFVGFDVNKYVAELLPEKAKPLSGPISSTLQTVATEQTQKLFTTEQFQSFWKTANTSAHAGLVKSLLNANSSSNTNEIIYLRSDQVVLNLGVVLQNAKEGLASSGLGFVSNLNVSGVNTQVTITTIDSLPQIILAVRIINSLSFWLPILTLATLAGMFLLAKNKRKALGTVLIFTTVLLVIQLALVSYGGVAGNAALSSSGTNSLSPGSSMAIYSIITGDLASYTQAALWVCVLALLFVFLGGSSQWALWVRTHIADLLSPQAKTPAVQWLSRNNYAIIAGLVATNAVVAIATRFQNITMLVILTIVVGMACIVLLSLSWRSRPRKK